MKKLHFKQAIGILLLIVLCYPLSAQKVVTNTPSSFTIVPALRDREPEPEPDGLEIQDRQFMRKKKKEHKNLENALPIDQIDPLSQKKQGSRGVKAPIVNFEGLSGQTVLDDNGAVGPNHYIQMINWSMQIFDKSGSSLYGPTALSSVFPGSQDVGDPIVLYDELADRWFISQFQNTGMVIAISQTPDPLGSWYQYEYNQGTLPDYPKIGLWTDGYYMSANTSNNVVIYERDEMLAGNPGARQLMLQLPSYTQGGGFFTPTAVDFEGFNLPPVNSPHYIVSFTDDGWGGGFSDEYLIWEIDVDWVTTSNTSLTLSDNITATPFSTNIGTSGWEDIPQPGVSQKIDGMLDICMFPAKYMYFGSYASIVGCFTANAGSNIAGMRWFELRNNYDGGGWYVYQEGNYSPDNTFRFNGSIGIDVQGNIGLGYNVSSSSVFPGIRYTGRLSSDPLGVMTFAEEVIANGTAAVNPGGWDPNRWADYSAMTLDHTDGLTFWYTNQYCSGSSTAKSKVASFKLAPDLPVDMGVTAFVAPVDGSLSATEAITVTVKNFGINPTTTFDVSYTVNGGAAVTEAVSQAIASQDTWDYTFTQTADMSAYGTYDLVAWTTVAGDGMAINDTSETSVLHNFSDDVLIASIISPSSGMGLTATETVSVTIQNLGTTDATGFPVSFQINGGAVVSETVTQNISALSSVVYTFAATADLSVYGTYDVLAYTDMATDGNHNNDTLLSVVESLEPQFCEPTSDCSWGDGFEVFTLNTITNTSSCSPGGYGDFTSQSTQLVQGDTYTIYMEQTSGYAQVIAIWIDFNDDATFDASEQLVANFNAGIGPTYNTDITIPVSAQLGTHRLRARSIWSNSAPGGPLDPCDAYEYGETEDYSVEIILFDAITNIYGNDFKFEVLNNVSDGNIKVMINGADDEFNLSVVNILGQEVYTENLNVNSEMGFEKIIDLSSLKSGSYMVKLKNDRIETAEKIIIK